VVFVEDRLGPRQIEVVLAEFLPGQLAQPGEVVADNGMFGRGGRHAFQSLEFALSFLENRLGHAGRLDPLAQLVDGRDVGIHLPELLLDRLELFLEVELALRAFDLGAHVALNLLRQPQDFELAVERGIDFSQALTDIERLEQLLFLNDSEREVGRQEIGQRVRPLNAFQNYPGLFGDVGAELDDLAGGLTGTVRQGLQLD